MSWFSTTPHAPKVEVSHILGAGMQAHGEYRFEGGLLIDDTASGTFEGAPANSAILVSPTGQVHGPVSAQTIVAAGRIEGNLTAERIWLKASADIRGDIRAHALHVEPGARVEGQLSIGPQDLTVHG